MVVEKVNIVWNRKESMNFTSRIGKRSIQLRLIGFRGIYRAAEIIKSINLILLLRFRSKINSGAYLSLI